MPKRNVSYGSVYEMLKVVLLRKLSSEKTGRIFFLSSNDHMKNDPTFKINYSVRSQNK